MKPLTSRQRKFCEHYASDPCATRAAKSAGYSPKTAYAIGQENLKKPEIQESIKRIQEDADTARIAQIDEVKAFWSETMRDTEMRMEHRLRASELLCKSGGGFVAGYKAEIGNETRESRVVIYLPERDPAPEMLER